MKPDPYKIANSKRYQRKNLKKEKAQTTFIKNTSKDNNEQQEETSDTQSREKDEEDVDKLQNSMKTLFLNDPFADFEYQLNLPPIDDPIYHDYFDNIDYQELANIIHMAD